MRSREVIVAAFACSFAGCLDTKADMAAAAVDAGAWGAGAGSVKPPLAQASAGSAWLVQAAGTGGAPQHSVTPMQPMAAGGGARAQAGAVADADARRNLPIVRARSTDAGMLDAGAPDSGVSDAEPKANDTFDGGTPELDGAIQDASTFDAAEQLPPEHAIVERPGDLVITELMIDPKAITDAEGEWIELYNATEATLELRDCQLDDGDESLHDVPAVLVEAGAYVTIAREAEPGFSADLVVPLSLTNSADSIAIVCRGEEIDRVSYDKAAEFAIKAGASLSLDPEHLDVHANDAAGAWCESTAAFATDLGSPGHANPSCHSAETAESHDESEWEHEEGASEVEQPDAGSTEAHDAGELPSDSY